MSKKLLLFTFSVLLIISSCNNQQQNPQPKMTIPGNNAPVVMTSSTETTIPARPSTTVQTMTPNLNVAIPVNTLIAYAAGNKGIYELSYPGGQISQIIVNPGGNILYFSPSWSASGDKIVFARSDSFGSKIYIVNRDGSGLRLLRDNAGTDPAWSPDGEHIAYTIDFSLYVTDKDGKRLQHLGNSSAIGFFPAWSPDGKRLALLGASGVGYNASKIYLIDSDGNNLHPISDAVAGESHLAWSPDGSKIAFRSFEGCGDIDVLDLKSGEITNLTNTPGIVEEDPAWSSDGNYIVFSRASYTPCEQDKTQSYYGGDLFIMKANGQNVTKLGTAKSGLQPSWWPAIILRSGWMYSITQAGANLNVHDLPGKSAKSLVILPEGEVFTVLDGPQNVDGYSWWHIRCANNIEGWIVDVPGWYMFNSISEVQP